MAGRGIPEWIGKLAEKGKDISECLQYLREQDDRDEKIRMDKAEREERAAQRADQEAKRHAHEQEENRKIKLTELEIHREIKLRELEIQDKRGNNPIGEGIRPKINLPKFDESQDIEIFLTSFERLVELHKWPEHEWPVRLVPQLSGKALEAYSRMSLEDSKDYGNIKTAILERYGLNAAEYRERFRHSRQRSDESLNEYAIRL